MKSKKKATTIRCDGTKGSRKCCITERASGKILRCFKKRG
jgi:hypothetical protein